MTYSYEGYRIRKSAKKYIELKHEELYVLQQVDTHEIVTSFILHDLFKALVNSSYSSTSISNRIRKFIEYNILVRKEEEFIINHSTQLRYYYSIGENGYQLLTDFFRFDSYTLPLHEEDVQIPSINETVLSTFANDLYLQCKNEGYNLYHSKFKDHWLAYLFTRKNEIIVPFLKTSWVFENENQLILLILNAPINNHSGYEKIINNVLNRFAHESTIDEKHFIVIFSIAEHNFRIKVPSIRQQIHHIKGNMPSFRTWHSNLEIYTLSFERVKERIMSLLLFVDREAGFKYSLHRKLDGYLQQITDEGFSLHSIPIRTLTAEKKNGFQTFHTLNYLQDTRHIITIAGLEGSVKTFQILAALEKQLFNSGYLYNHAPIHLFVIYPSKVCQDNDVIFSGYSKNIWISDLNQFSIFSKAALKEVTLNQLFGRQLKKNVLFYKSSIE